MIRPIGVLFTQTVSTGSVFTLRSSGWLRWVAQIKLLRFKNNPDEKHFFIMEKIEFEKFSVTLFENSFRRSDISFVNGLQRKCRFA